MKSIISVLATTLLFSNYASSAVMGLNCKTDKGTELNLVYDNYSSATNRAELISIKVAGKDLTSQISGRFGTSGGRPYFTLSNFPKVGLDTHFNMYTTGTYTVAKAGSMSGDTYSITCSVVSPESKPVDNSF